MSDEDDDNENIIGFPHFERLDFKLAADEIEKLYGSRRPRHFVLVNREPVAVDMATWATEFERRYTLLAQRNVDPWRVARTTISKDVYVSTVFLGLDHSFSLRGDGPPILFETMIFGGKLDQEYQTRCATWDEAEIMHGEACGLVRAGHLRVVK